MEQFSFTDFNDFFPALLVQWRYHVVKNSGLFSEFLTVFRPRETLNYWSVEKLRLVPFHSGLLFPRFLLAHVSQC